MHFQNAPLYSLLSGKCAIFFDATGTSVFADVAGGEEDEGVGGDVTRVSDDIAIEKSPSEIVEKKEQIADRLFHRPTQSETGGGGGGENVCDVVKTIGDVKTVLDVEISPDVKSSVDDVKTVCDDVDNVDQLDVVGGGEKRSGRRRRRGNAADNAT